MVSPVISRPALDVSPPPPSRSTSALAQPGWRRSLPRPKHPRLWGLGLGSLALGLVNGALVISAGIGLVAYQQILQLSPRQRKGLIQRLQNGLPLPTSPQQQALILAGIAGTSTYTFTALWHSTHSLLMALLLTGQGALALFAVGALLRGSTTRSTDRSDTLWNAAPVAQVEHNLGLLSHPDPLKRLVAVRQLVRLVEQGAIEGNYLAGVSVRSHLLDCFQLQIHQENDPVVRSALESGQNLLRQAKPLAPSSATPLAVDGAIGAVEMSDPALAPQPVAAPDLAARPKNLVLSDLEAPLDQASPGQRSAIAPEAAPEAPPEARTEFSTTAASTTPTPTPATTAPPRAIEPTIKGRRTVEYVEYLDI